jgi:hypothetical protein
MGMAQAFSSNRQKKAPDWLVLSLWHVVVPLFLL